MYVHVCSTRCPVAEPSRSFRFLQQRWVWVSTRGSFSGDRRCVTWTASRRGLVGRSPSRCGFGRTGSFSLIFLPPNPRRNRGSGRKASERKKSARARQSGPAVLHFCLFRAAETTGSETSTVTYGTGTVGCWFGALQCHRRHHRLTIWNGNRSNVAALFDPKPGGALPLTQPSSPAFFARRLRIGAYDGLRCASCSQTAGVQQQQRSAFSNCVCRDKSTNGRERLDSLLVYLI